MNKLLIVKTGTTFPTLKTVRGDFDAWVARGLGDGAICEVADATLSPRLPDAADYAGVIVTGSHAMVTERTAWSERASEWLWKTVTQGVPTLGICYGHQLLAAAFGGVVGDNPAGWEAGTVVVTPNAFGANDRLLGAFRGPFKAHACHRQSVLSLPKGAVPLATTRQEACAAFALSPCAWGVQFHPEFDSRIEKVYVLRHADALAAQGEDVNYLLASCMETGAGRQIFQQFLTVVSERERPSRAKRSLARAV